MKKQSSAVVVMMAVIFASSAIAQSTQLARLTDREDILGWEAVGRLDFAGGGFCTGTLIAADLVLTAAHCVYQSETKAPVSAQDIVFKAGLRDGTVIAERTISQVVAHPNFDPASNLTIKNIRHDVALLRLEQPITIREANPFVLHQGSIGASRVSVVSYGKGRAETLSRQRRCELIKAYSDGIMIFDCDVTFGSSGAPVFAHTRNRGRIASIISGMTMFEGRKVSVGMVLPQIVAELKRLLRANTMRPNVVVRNLGSNGQGSGIGAKFVKSKKP